jgi:FAD/FMN-containing dehydrogenase
MTREPEIELQPFQGLIQNEGRGFSNWGLRRRTIPAVYAEPITYADMQSLVRDHTRFPTPVNPVGSMMSVTSTFVNDGGTMICLRKLDEVIGLERRGRPGGGTCASRMQAQEAE